MKKILMPINRQNGHVSTEWVVVTFVIVVALFTPMPESGQSAMGMMMQAIREFYEHHSFLLSLP